MPTTRQDSSFAQEATSWVDEVKMSNTALDNAISWMSDNLSPDDVFSHKQLSQWAENNGFVEKEQ